MPPRGGYLFCLFNQKTPQTCYVIPHFHIRPWFLRKVQLQKDKGISQIFIVTIISIWHLFWKLLLLKYYKSYTGARKISKISIERFLLRLKVLQKQSWCLVAWKEELFLVHIFHTFSSLYNVYTNGDMKCHYILKIPPSIST